MTGAKEPNKTRDAEIDVDTDLDESLAVGATKAPQRAAGASEPPGEDAVIEVTDAEIEPLPSRTPTQPSPRANSVPPSVQRSKPPERPSMRPRSSAVPPLPGSVGPGGIVTGSARPGAVLPPPRGNSLIPSAPSSGGWGGTPPSTQASADPWLLANRTLELSRARARIIELEEHIAFRDARIATLEDRLAKIQGKLDELEQKRGPASEPAQRSRSSVVAPAAVAPAAVAPAVAAPAAVAPAVVAPAARSAAPAARPAEREASNEVTVVRAVAAQPTAVAAQPTAAATRGIEASRAQPVPGPAKPDATSITAPESSTAYAVTESDDSESDGSESDGSESDAVESDGSESDAVESDPRPSRAGSNADDLRSIAGIGPRFEAALRKQGITRLSQIAAWSEDDVRQVAKALKIPKSRILKGRWIESAREAIGTRAASD